jgi:hypothetical protein
MTVTVCLHNVFPALLLSCLFTLRNTQEEGSGLANSDHTPQLHKELYNLFHVHLATPLLQDSSCSSSSDALWNYVDAKLIDQFRDMLKAQ